MVMQEDDRDRNTRHDALPEGERAAFAALRRDAEPNDILEELKSIKY